VVWVEQDRLSRIKYAADQSPADALFACLKFAGLGLQCLDAVSLGSDHAQLIQWLGDDPEPQQHPGRLLDEITKSIIEKQP